jgi:hypothetical protein
MKKRDELDDPTSCINKAYDDELTFVLLARDAAAPNTIRAWVQYRIKAGKNHTNDPQIVDALRTAAAMEIQRDDIRERSQTNRR